MTMNEAKLSKACQAVADVERPEEMDEPSDRLPKWARFYIQELEEAADDCREALKDTDEDAPDVCEGCPSPATHRDNQGVPLCKSCFDSLVADAANETDTPTDEALSPTPPEPRQ